MRLYELGSNDAHGQVGILLGFSNARLKVGDIVTLERVNLPIDLRSRAEGRCLRGMRLSTVSDTKPEEADFATCLRLLMPNHQVTKHSTQEG